MINAAWLGLLLIVSILAVIYYIAHILIWFWGLLKEVFYSPVLNRSETELNEEIKVD